MIPAGRRLEQVYEFGAQRRILLSGSHRANGSRSSRDGGHVQEG